MGWQKVVQPSGPHTDDCHLILGTLRPSFVPPCWIEEDDFGTIDGSAR